jgi:hypothetical protein
MNITKMFFKKSVFFLSYIAEYVMEHENYANLVPIQFERNQNSNTINNIVGKDKH